MSPPPGHALHSCWACFCSRIEEPRRTGPFTPGHGSSTVPRILLAWLPVASPCPQDTGSQPGHRGEATAAKPAPSPLPSASQVRNGQSLGGKHSCGAARSRSRCCGRSSSLPAANAPNYTNAAQQMRRGVSPVSPPRGSCLRLRAQASAQAPGTWSTLALMVQSLRDEHRCPGLRAECSTAASLPCPACRALLSPALPGSMGLCPSADQAEGMSLSFLICKRA